MIQNVDVSFDSLSEDENRVLQDIFDNLVTEMNTQLALKKDK